MGVAAGQTRRRWLLVATGLAITCALPAVVSALPVAAGRTANPAELRARILASANLPYSGYVESDGALGVPNLGELSDITAMLDGTTRMRVWQASASTWRADVLSDAGERDTYQLRGKTYIWDSGSELLTEVTGNQPVRPPRAADLLPPALALRLLRDAGGTARITSLPAERIAGRDAGGLRLVPTDPATTIGQIDIWADSANGLPLQVEITGRGSGQVVLASRFLQVAFNRPSGQVLTPAHGPGTGFTAASPARHRQRCRRPGRRAAARFPGGTATGTAATGVPGDRHLRRRPIDVRGHHPQGPQRQARPSQRAEQRRNPVNLREGVRRPDRHPADHGRPRSSMRLL